MRKWIIDILVLLGVALITGACVREQTNPSSSEEGVTDCVISFGTPRGLSVDVTTKGELGIVRESNVFNLYLMIFDSSGKKFYGHYFDSSNLNDDSQSNYWTVTNMSAAGDDPTHGTLHINTAKKTGCTIVAVANMNPNDLDVSAGLLSTVQTLSALQDIVATQVRSEIAANSGFFLMTGQVDNVNIEGDASDANDISKKTLSLKRLYAKVTFNVRIAKNAPIRSFIPYKWQVVNVPTCSYLLERTSPYDDAADTDAEFFSTDELGFETEKLTTAANDCYADGVTKVSIHSFSFYMMENRNAPASGITTYADREKQNKNNVVDHGTYYTATNGDYTYADKHSTYVVLTGKIVMGVSSGGNPNATLDATVRYVIHLGDFGTDVTDFNTLRNHNYVYDINIAGAEQIKAEVNANDGESGSLDENEPGATGRVVVALEEIFDSDCHYSTQVISFHAAYMDPDNISWYVETPFNPNGLGLDDIKAGTVQKQDIDYTWVEFFVNEIDENTGLYTENRVKYLPHDYDFRDIDGNVIPAGDKRRTMYVDELVDYLVWQKERYDTAQENDFDADAGTGGPKITVTAFINEYYYTVHPLTGEYDPTLWKLVVNHPERRLHILASSATSADGESTLIGSSFTIQQRSIQSIYAVHETAGLQSAWGMEFVDDNNDETGEADYWRNKDPEDCGNTSPTNGRLNTLKLWGILDKDGNENLIGERWDKFLNLYDANETPHLWDIKKTKDPDKDYNYLRYSCLSRNRDLDGDDIIDADEIRWYMASDIQLIGVFMGSYGIEGDARLYQRTAAQQAGSGNAWRQHIIASNRYVYDPNAVDDWNNSNKYPRIVWAEEGVNGSNMNYSGSDQTTKFGTRCVRNLGYYVEGGLRKDITLTDNPNVEPDDYVIMTRKHLNADGTVTSPYTGDYDNRTFYEFDCSRINLASLRDPVEHELIGHNEHSKMACLSSKFVTAPEINLISMDGKGSYKFNNVTYNLRQIRSLNQYLDASFPNLDANFSVCPEGYRLPNVREMSLIWTYLSSLETGDSDYLGSASTTMPARTYWSKGVEGDGKMSGKWGWGMNVQHLLMAAPSNSISKPRCVKDI